MNDSDRKRISNLKRLCGNAAGAALLAESRTAIPWLIEMIERQAERNKWLEGVQSIYQHSSKPTQQVEYVVSPKTFYLYQKMEKQIAVMKDALEYYVEAYAYNGVNKAREALFEVKKLEEGNELHQ